MNSGLAIYSDEQLAQIAGIQLDGSSGSPLPGAGKTKGLAELSDEELADIAGVPLSYESVYGPERKTEGQTADGQIETDAWSAEEEADREIYGEPLKLGTADDEYLYGIEKINKVLSSRRAATAAPMSTKTGEKDRRGDAAKNEETDGEMQGPPPEVWGPEKPPGTAGIGPAPEKSITQMLSEKPNDSLMGAVQGFLKKTGLKPEDARLEESAKADNIMNLARRYNIPPERVEQNYEAFAKELQSKYGKEGTAPGLILHMMEFAITGPVVAGLVTHPAATAIGLGAYMALAEAENAAVSLRDDIDYKFGAGKGLRDLLPLEADEITKDTVELIDFLGKAVIAGGLIKKAPAVAERFTKDIITEYGLPEKINVDAAKLKTYLQRGEGHGLSAEESAVIRELGLTGEQYRTALKTGVDITIPTETIVRITDKPYWGKLKQALNLKPTSEVISRKTDAATWKYGDGEGRKTDAETGGRGDAGELLLPEALNTTQRHYLTLPVSMVRTMALNGDTDARAVLGIVGRMDAETGRRKDAETIKDGRGERATRRQAEKIEEGQAEKTGTENQYMTMPLEEVRMNAAAGSKQAQEALAVREEEIRKSERLKRGLEKKGLIGERRRRADAETGREGDGELKEPWKMTREEFRPIYKSNPNEYDKVTNWDIKDRAGQTPEEIASYYEKKYGLNKIELRYESTSKVNRPMETGWDEQNNRAIITIEPRFKDSPIMLRHEIEHAIDKNLIYQALKANNRSMLRGNPQTHHAMYEKFEPDYIHRKSVKQALLSGKPVSPEVLAEYPDLKPTEKPIKKIQTDAGIVKKDIEKDLLGDAQAIGGMNVKKLKNKDRKFILRAQEKAKANGYTLAVNMKTGKTILFKGDTQVKPIRETVAKELENAVTMEELPQSTRTRVQAMVDVLGADIDVSGLTHEQVKAAVKDIQIDDGKEKSIRAQALLNELFDAIDRGEVRINTNKGLYGVKRAVMDVPVDEVLDVAGEIGGGRADAETGRRGDAETIKDRRGDRARGRREEKTEEKQAGQKKGMTFEEFEKQVDEVLKADEGRTGEKRAAVPMASGKPVSGTSKKGMALKGSDWNESLSPEAEVPQTVNKSEILKYVEKAFGVPIRGRVTYRWKAPGMYYPQDWVVRMRRWGELPVLAHEVAHHMDVAMFAKKYGTGWRRAFTDKENRRAIRKELADLDYDQAKRRTSEGFAEFIRHYLTTGEAQERAPEFYDLFVDKILPDNPGLGKILNRLGDMLKIWQLQGAENRILAQVDFKGEHTFKTTFAEKKTKLYRWFQTKWNDEFYPVQQIVRDVERITGKELPPSRNPAKLLEYGKSKAGMIARTFVMEKAINEKGEPIGPGLAEVLKPIGKNDMNQFIAYAVARRAQILHAREIESGIDIEDADYIAKKFKSDTYDTALDGVTQWSDHLLNWIVRAGGLSEEVAALMRELNPIYIPFKRAFMDELSAFRQKEYTKKGKPAGSIDESRESRDVGASYVDKGKPVKELKGSGMAIVNPIESLIAQATEMISKAQKIRIAATVADLAEQEGVAGIIDEVPPPMGMASGRMDRKQMLEFLKEAGAEIHPNDPAMDKVFTVFFQDTKYKGKENVVSIWRNGERKFYELHHELYRAIAGMDMEQVPPYLHLVAGFSRMLRLGATGLNISFGLIRNPFRDAQSYVVLSKQKAAHIRDVPRGLARELKSKEGDLIWRFKSLGGSVASMVGYDRAATINVYDELLQEMVGGTKGKVLKVVRHPINTIREVISGFWEMAPRSAELEGRYKELRKEHPEWSEEDIFIEAFNDAQDVTVNFTKSGQYAKQLNQVAAFFNVGIRGPEKLFRTFRQRKAHTFLQVLKYITLPAVALYLWNRKKQWYRNLPPAYKYNNMFFEVGDQIIRLPIPFDIGLIGSAMPLAAMDYLETKDPAYIEGLAEVFKGQIPNPTPSAFGPLIDVWRNKNWLGQPIESKAMEGLPKAERTRDYTTGIAKIMARGANAVGIQVSPVQLDYLGNQYTGGMSRILPKGNVKKLADVPVLADVLVKMPENPRRQLDKFFGEWERLSQREKADLASREEKQRLMKLKPVYGQLTRMHFKRLRNFRKEDDREKIREEYVRIQKLLEKVEIR